MSKGTAFGDYIASCAMAHNHIPKSLHLTSSCILYTSATHLRALRKFSHPTNLFPNCSFGFHSSGEISHDSSKSSDLQSNESGHGWLGKDISNINNVDDALCFYNMMTQMRPLPGVVEFNQLFGHVVKMKNYAAVISLYRDMRVKGVPFDKYTMTIVINCYCLVGRVDFGFSVFGGFFKHGVMPNVVTFGTLLRGLFLQHMVAQAEELFCKIIYEKLCQPNGIMFGIVIDGLSKAGNTERAIDFLRLMENVDTKSHTGPYNTIIDALCRDKMIDQALCLLCEMIKKGTAPNVITYNCLIRGFCQLRKWNDVKELLNGMIASGNCPDVYSYNILIHSYSKEGWMKDANDLFEMMVQRRVTANIVTYRTLMDGYCLRGQIDEARRIFDVMVAHGLVPDIMSYNILIHGYFKERKIEEAIQMFEDIPRNGLIPRIDTYTILLKGLFQSGRCNTAKEVFSKMQLGGLKPNFYTHCVMLDGLCKAGDVDEALMLLHDLDSEERRIEMYNILLKGLFQSGRRNTAKEVFSKMQLDALKPNFYTHCVILDGLCQAGDVDEALMLLHDLDSEERRIEMYNIIINGLYKCGRFDQARDIFNSLSRKGLDPNVITYTTMIRALCRHDLVEDAKALFIKMEENGCPANEYSYNVIIQGLLQGGLYDDASVYLKRMKREGFTLTDSNVLTVVDLISRRKMSLPFLFDSRGGTSKLPEL